MVNLTIDGKTVQVPDGTTVLQAAEAAGVHVPTLCNHPALKPFGGCRLCLVEVEGARTLQPACTLPVSEKMVVLTSTDKVKAARRFVLTLIFSDRNHFCPFCQVSGGDCELQNAALDEGMSHWPYQPNWQHFPVDATHEYLVMDHNRCILCHRCVRACGQLVGNYTLGIEERGSSSMLVADTGLPWGESTCVDCGTCAAVCPTGAIIERRSAYQGHDESLEETKSVCVGCSVGCGVTVFTRDNRLVRVLGDWDAPVNGGVLCETGRFLPMEEDRARVTTPMVKKDGKLQPATWEEALQAVAKNVRPGGVAALASTRLPVEALDLFKQVFANGLKSDMVTSIEEGRATEMASQLAAELGQPFESGLDALKNADLVLEIGADMGENHMVAGFLVKRNLPGGTRLIIVDPNENKFDEHAAEVLKATKGSDTDVINGLKAGVIKLGLRDGDGNQAEKDLAAAAAATGIPADTLLAAAGMIGIASKPAFVYGKGLSANRQSVALKALVELSKLTNAALVSVKGEANSLAAAQLQMEKAFALNGHKAVYLALGDDIPSQRLTQTLEKGVANSGRAFLAVQASYTSRLTAMADVVLPVSMWAEQEGHYVNLEGRVQEAHAALTAPAGVKSNAEALKALAETLGVETREQWQETLCARPAPVAIAL